MAIEKFLTRKAAKVHSLKNHGTFAVFLEIFAGEEKLKALFDHDIHKTESFRKAIESELSSDPLKRKSIAERWVLFIKPKISVLKFISTLCAAFIAIYGLGSLIFTFVGKVLHADKPALIEPPLIMAGFFIVTAILLILKYLADKKAFWYEYIIQHLEAIIKLAPSESEYKKQH